MQRLVYAPKVHAYIRTQGASGNSDVLDISPFIVSGSVNRVVNAASTAQITLRNPRHKFTTTVNHGNVFHPMDPITIFLTRLPNRPVQVFTGYLDEIPFLQLKPGTITLSASCTLKRLLYSFFDPALPYMVNFMGKYGWVVDKQNGQAFNLNAQVKSITGTKGEVTDGSIGQLLYATLNEIGHWNDSNVFIEKLPQGIADTVVKLYSALAQENKAAEQEYINMMRNVIGSGTYGGGGTNDTTVNTGDVQGLNKVIPILTAAANKYNLPPVFVIAVCQAESGLTGRDSPGNSHTGWFQMSHDGGQPYVGSAGITTSPTSDQTHDLGFASNLFCKAAAIVLQKNPSFKEQANWRKWGETTQGAPGQYIAWLQDIAVAQQAYNQFGQNSYSTSGGGSSSNIPADKNRLAAIQQEADRIAKLNLTYQWAGGHTTPAPKNGPFDCSSAVSRVLQAAGYNIQTMVASGFENVGKPGKGQVTIVILPGNPPDPSGKHVYMVIDGRAWGTSKINNPDGGPEWIPTNDPYTFDAGGSSGTPIYRHLTGLDESPTNPNNGAGGSDDNVNGGDPSTGGAATDTLAQAKASAFATYLDFPSIQDTAEAVMLQGAKSLMNDKPLMPFIEQLCQASLRSFQSAPNGDFWAFYPDWFGAFGKTAYWSIDELEVLDGGIQLSDDSLATHVFVVGDTIPGVPIGLPQMLSSGGVINIFNAFQDNFIKKGRNSPLADHNSAVKFLQHYGPRPVYLEEAFIRSPFFEAFYAYQQFCILWSKQYATPFQLTFMPEIYPGGLVQFENQNLQCYVEEVTHSWDLESGYTTEVVLSAPAALHDDGTPLGEGMILAGKGGVS